MVAVAYVFLTGATISRDGNVWFGMAPEFNLISLFSSLHLRLPGLVLLRERGNGRVGRSSIDRVRPAACHCSQCGVIVARLLGKRLGWAKALGIVLALLRFPPASWRM